MAGPSEDSVKATIETNLPAYTREFLNKPMYADLTREDRELIASMNPFDAIRTANHLVQRVGALEKKVEDAEYKIKYCPDTGLFSKKYFEDEIFPRTVMEENAQRKRQAREDKISDKGLALFYGDGDGFKWVNETLGHDYGDVVIKYSADVVKNTLREPMYAARKGGDEFAIVVPGVTIAEAEVVAGRLLKASRGLYLLGGNAKENMTMAGGKYTSFTLGGTHSTLLPFRDGRNNYIDITATAMIDHADLALRTAKKELRRGTFSWHPPIN